MSDALDDLAELAIRRSLPSWLPDWCVNRCVRRGMGFWRSRVGVAR